MEQRSRQLRKNKALAGGLLAGATLLFVVARLQRGAGWEWLGAFAEAAMVGALADWFAVVALFRHPLGLPIPHTAIIPGKKAAIAENLAQFIHDKFLATDALLAKLRAFDPAERLCGYLTSADNAERLGSGISALLAESLDFVDDARVRNLLTAALDDQVGKFDLAGSAGTLIDTLRRGDRHQAVLDDLLNRLAVWLSTEEAQGKLAAFIDQWLSSDYPMLAMFLPNRDQFAKGAGEKVARKVNEFVQQVSADPAHELRRRFDDGVAEFGARLRSDPGLRAKVDAIKKEAIANEQLAGYAQALGDDLKAWLRQDLAAPQPKITGKLAEFALGIGSALAGHPALKQSINEHIEAIAGKYASTLQQGMTRHIADTVKQWEDERFIEEIELSIGSDLQFIRMNGTLVGGGIGLLLHAISLLLG